jgi:chromosomal replication initiation ATPase DnaA
MMSTIGFQEKNRLFEWARANAADFARRNGMTPLVERMTMVKRKVARINDQNGKGKPKLYDIDAIVDAVVVVFDIPKWRLLSKERTGPVSLARNCCYKLIWDAGYTSEEAAHAFDRKNHGTALNGMEAVERMLGEDCVLSKRYGAVLDLLKRNTANAAP